MNRWGNWLAKGEPDCGYVRIAINQVETIGFALLNVGFGSAVGRYAAMRPDMVTSADGTLAEVTKILVD